MPRGLPFTRRFGIVDHGYKPVSVVPDVKDCIAIHEIGILECAANILKSVPVDRLDDVHPGCDFVRGIWVAFNRFAQMLTRNDMHSFSILHNM